ncbi:hypothetical protein U1Q18_025583 [Sarracenia purpurea var. burkii]
MQWCALDFQIIGAIVPSRLLPFRLSRPRERSSSSSFHGYVKYIWLLSIHISMANFDFVNQRERVQWVLSCWVILLIRVGFQYGKAHYSIQFNHGQLVLYQFRVSRSLVSFSAPMIFHVIL